MCALSEERPCKHTAKSCRLQDKVQGLRGNQTYLDLPAQSLKLWEDKCLWFKSPSLRFFIMAVLANSNHIYYRILQCGVMTKISFCSAFKCSLVLGDWDYKIKPNWLAAQRTGLAGEAMGKAFDSLRKLYPLAPVAEFLTPKNEFFKCFLFIFSLISSSLPPCYSSLCHNPLHNHIHLPSSKPWHPFLALLNKR